MACSAKRHSNKSRIRRSSQNKKRKTPRYGGIFSRKRLRGGGPEQEPGFRGRRGPRLFAKTMVLE